MVSGLVFVRHRSSRARRGERVRQRAVGRVPGPLVPGTNCPAFPANNVWNTPITTLPVAVNSATWLASMSSATTYLHPDTAHQEIPRALRHPVDGRHKNTVFAHVTFQYASESDRRPYPLTASTGVEGGSDRHALMVDPYRSASSAPCHALRDLRHLLPRQRSIDGRIGRHVEPSIQHASPGGFTSADAAGLPILPGLVNYNEVASHAMDHAIRFTAECTQESYLWPARHEAGQATSSCPPMGARFRLNESFSLPASQCSAFCQTVLDTMKTYG